MKTMPIIALIICYGGMVLKDERNYYAADKKYLQDW